MSAKRKREEERKKQKTESKRRHTVESLSLCELAIKTSLHIGMIQKPTANRLRDDTFLRLWQRKKLHRRCPSQRPAGQCASQKKMARSQTIKGKKKKGASMTTFVCFFVSCPSQTQCMMSPLDRFVVFHQKGLFSRSPQLKSCAATA